ncbi:hypothetical protein JCM3765_002439 [Sporobolomyces pararoseus]
MPSASSSSSSTPLTDSELLSQSPYLSKLVLKGRLAPSRYSKLLISARSISKPLKPEIWECCGSSCKPCVLELYKQELKVWEECHPDGEEEQEQEEEEELIQEKEEEKGEKEKGNPKIEIGI